MGVAHQIGYVKREIATGVALLVSVIRVSQTKLDLKFGFSKFGFSGHTGVCYWYPCIAVQTVLQQSSAPVP